MTTGCSNSGIAAGSRIKAERSLEGNTTRPWSSDEISTIVYRFYSNSQHVITANSCIHWNFGDVHIKCSFAHSWHFRLGFSALFQIRASCSQRTRYVQNGNIRDVRALASKSPILLLIGHASFRNESGRWSVQTINRSNGTQISRKKKFVTVFADVDIANVFDIF